MSLIRFCILSHYALPIWFKIVSLFWILQLPCKIDINLNIISRFILNLSELHELLNLHLLFVSNRWICNIQFQRTFFDMISRYSLMFAMKNVCNVKTFTKLLLFDRKWMWYKGITSRYISIPLLRKIFVHIHHIVRISAF